MCPLVNSIRKRTKKKKTKKRNPASSKLITSLKQTTKRERERERKVPYSIFGLLLWEPTTADWRGKKILFLLYNSVLTLDFIQKKKNNETTILFFLISRFPVYVCVCVTKQPKIPFRLAFIIYNAPASFVNRNVGIGRETHTHNRKREELEKELNFFFFFLFQTFISLMCLLYT